MIFWFKSKYIIDSSVVQRYNNYGNYVYGARIQWVGSFYGVGFFSLFPLSTGHNISPGPKYYLEPQSLIHTVNKYGVLIMFSGSFRD
jgi:hypothetical protein